MNLLILLTYLFTFKSNNIKNLSGIDQRFPLKENKSLIPKIFENFEKKKLLDYLLLENINILNKKIKINKFYDNNIPKPFNLTNGGLMKHWNFDI